MKSSLFLTAAALSLGSSSAFVAPSANARATTSLSMASNENGNNGKTFAASALAAAYVLTGVVSADAAFAMDTFDGPSAPAFADSSIVLAGRSGGRAGGRAAPRAMPRSAAPAASKTVINRTTIVAPPVVMGGGYGYGGGYGGGYGYGYNPMGGIGGWTLSDNFPTLSADPVARNTFAQKCVEILTYHDFDGIDIDWEYPGYADHSGTPADTENFTKMLAAIRAALETLTRSTGKVYGLTAALPCAPKNMDNIEVEKLTTVLTEWNLMSYDFHGAWDDVTGMNAPLYYQGYGNEDFNIHKCVENYVARGVPRERINIGLPFYGRSFRQATKMNEPHAGNDLANWAEDDGTPQYFNVYNKLPHMIQMRDNKSKTQYAYINHAEQSTNPDALTLPEGWISFDDERAICDKVHYAQQNNLAGFIIWELSGDVLEDLRTPLLDITNRKLGDPSLQCCMLHSQDECEKERLERESATSSQMMSGFDSNRWAGGPEQSGSRIGQGCRGGLILAVISATLTLFW